MADQHKFWISNYTRTGTKNLEVDCFLKSVRNYCRELIQRNNVSTAPTDDDLHQDYADLVEIVMPKASNVYN